MFQTLLEPLGREAQARLTLLVNHVIAAEPEATRRLLAHSGALIEVEWTGWPAFLPAPPPAQWRVTPAGLLEVEDGSADPVDPSRTLVVSLDQPSLTAWAFAGAQGRPPMAVRGDVGLAAEIGWLAENLRWDIEDDLARIVGDAPARQLTQFGRAVAQGVQSLLQRLRPQA
jgi:ubiquinone biosynthesis protein UbiJ